MKYITRAKEYCRKTHQKLKDTATFMKFFYRKKIGNYERTPGLGGGIKLTEKEGLAMQRNFSTYSTLYSILNP